MSKRARMSLTPEFKAEAVALVRASGMSVYQVAKDLDLTETELRAWVTRAAQPGAPVGKSGSSGWARWGRWCSAGSGKSSGAPPCRRG